MQIALQRLECHRDQTSRGSPWVCQYDPVPFVNEVARGIQRDGRIKTIRYGKLGEFFGFIG